MKIHWLITLMCVVLVPFIGVARVVDVEQLYDPDELNLLDIPLACTGSYGIFCATGNEIMSLENSDVTPFTSISLPDSTFIDEFFFMGDKVLFRQGDAVVWADSKGCFDGMAFEDSDFSICAATDSTFFIIRPSDCSVMEVSLKQKAPKYIYRMEDAPVTAGKFGDSTVFISTEAIYMMLPEGTNLLHRHPLEIRAAAVTPMGIYFGTDIAMWRVVGIDSLEHVADGSIARIVGAGRLLYVVDGMGSLFKFSLRSEN